ncbi:hypothetical protein pb186bvf_018114 [Paramecium bursaria]
MQQKLWDDEYDDIMQSEISYHKFNGQLLTKQDWDYVFKFIIIHIGDEQVKQSIVNSSFQLGFINLLQILIGNNHQFDLKPTDNPIQIELIDRDIGRTYTKQQQFKSLEIRQELKYILQCYAEFDNEVGYSQGMNYIAAALIYHQIPQRINYFIKIVQTHRLNFIKGTPSLFSNIAQINYKIRKYIPKLSDHFKNIGLNDLCICFSNHILTILMQATPFKYQLIILNLYALNGEKIIRKLIIGMLEINQFKLLEINDLQQVSKYIQKEMVINFFDDLQNSRKNMLLLRLLSQIRLIKKQ